MQLEPSRNVAAHFPRWTSESAAFGKRGAAGMNGRMIGYNGRYNSGRNRQRGAGRIKALIWIVLIGLLVYLGIKIVPPFVNYYDLRDHMDQTATFAAVGNQTEMQIRQDIWKKIQDLEIPAQYDDLKVVRGNRRVQISCHYVVEVPFLGYTIRLNFTPETDKRGF
jgi:hypothetical protein